MCLRRTSALPYRCTACRMSGLSVCCRYGSRLHLQAVSRYWAARSPVIVYSAVRHCATGITRILQNARGRWVGRFRKQPCVVYKSGFACNASTCVFDGGPHTFIHAFVVAFKPLSLVKGKFLLLFFSWPRLFSRFNVAALRLQCRLYCWVNSVTLLEQFSYIAGAIPLH